MAWPLDYFSPRDPLLTALSLDLQVTLYFKEGDFCDVNFKLQSLRMQRQQHTVVRLDKYVANGNLNCLATAGHLQRINFIIAT